MATVYLARDLKHDRNVALKVLKPELTQALGRDRFLREIRTTAQLTHPHILPLLDSGDAAGTLFYVMPFVEGESLRGRLDREMQLPLDDALRIAGEVAGALAYAHSRDVVHRDIKPENILFESGHAVVADFGIARAIDAAGGEKLTETGLAVGTPSYMSPEQASGERRLDGRSDVYSLGCVLYEMLAGEPPYTGPTAQAIIARRLTDPVPPLRTVRETVPEPVEQAINRALAKVPADRFATAALFAEALGSRPLAAVTTSPPAPVEPAPSRRSWRLAVVGLGAMVVIAGGVALGRWLRPSPAGSRHPRTAIAVLPLENLSAEGPQAYFAPGLQDELLTQLSKVAALTVISRTSVVGYQGTAKPLRVIAAELGVGSVVEGSVQVVGNRLRVNVQLIDAATDGSLWAEKYDRTLDDAFEVQSEIAQAIVEAVGAKLTEAEAGAIAAAPTANTEAYRLYVQGREYLARAGIARPNVESAQQLFEQALALDPGFALAHAALSEAHGRMYWWRYDPSPARAARQRDAAEAALRLAPDLPQAHTAMGLAHYWGRRDYRRALDELGIALKGLPNDAQLWQWIAAVHRRLGDWNDAVAAFEKAAQLDPRDANLFVGCGETYVALRRYAEAVRAYDRASSLAPDLAAAALGKGWVYVRWQGQLDTLRAVLSHLPRDATVQDRTRANALLQLFLWERHPDSLLQVLRTARVAVYEAQNLFLPSALYTAWAHQLLGDRLAARAAFDSARVLLDSVVRERPDDWPVHSARGLALAGLGRRTEALLEARWLQHSAVYREDAYSGRGLAAARAQILAQAGDADAALDEIEPLLEEPNGGSVHTLQLDPLWDPLRDRPRFKALLSKYAGR